MERFCFAGQSYLHMEWFCLMAGKQHHIFHVLNICMSSFYVLSVYSFLICLFLHKDSCSLTYKSKKKSLSLMMLRVTAFLKKRSRGQFKSGWIRLIHEVKHSESTLSLGCEKIRLSFWDGGHIYLSAWWHVTQVVKYVFPTTYLIFELFSFLWYRSFFICRFVTHHHFIFALNVAHR